MSIDNMKYMQHKTKAFISLRLSAGCLATLFVHMCLQAFSQCGSYTPTYLYGRTNMPCFILKVMSTAVLSKCFSCSFLDS